MAQATKTRPDADPTQQRPLRRGRGLYSSAVGKKYVMAITGIVLMGYVLAHMVGNLKLYQGAEHMNAYGEWLREIGEPAAPREFLLWVMRVALISAALLHLHAAWGLTRLNWAARQKRYAKRSDYIAADFASRTMRWSGIIVLAFVLFHLADLTFGTANPDFEYGLVYQNVVASFERPVVAVFYIVANLALGVHLYHGAWSIFQSLGAANPRFNALRRGFAIAFTLVVVGGNVSFPIAVMTGVVS